MSEFDRTYGGYRIFVGDLGPRVGKYELEREFEYYGPLINVWVARNPPGFAFLVYKYKEDADRAARALDGRTVCGRRVRVEHARPMPPRGSRRPPPPRRWDPSMKCYTCGERGHFARDCDRDHYRSSRRSSRYSRSRSRSPIRSRSRSRSHSRSAGGYSRSRSRSYSPGRR
ncbi:serine/arginine-rich splicing factor 7-like isoform X1 [Glandiceps talaboti]